MKTLSFFFLFFIGLVHLNGQNCNDPNEPAICQVYDNYPIEEKLVKIYFHVYRDDNGNGGPPPGALDGTIATLHKHFGTTLGSPDSKITFFYNDCETRLIDDTFLQTTTQACNIFDSEYRHLDGIDIHLRAGHISTVSKVHTVPGDELLIGDATPNSIPYYLTEVIAHEMGHCLGLLHTFQGTCSSNSNDPNPCNANEDCDGNVLYSCNPDCNDYVSDTNLDLRWEVSNCTYVPNTQNSTCMGSPPFETPPVTNIMSSYPRSCKRHFTDGQIMRMHALMPSAVIHPELDLCCGNGADTYIIDPNVIYDEDQKMEGDLIVNSGSTLVVKSKLEFGEGKGIIVRRGAKLIVNAGHLTKCPTTADWRGIIVEGNSNMEQPDHLAPLTSSTLHQAGIVIMRNSSLVEWARTAISTNYVGSWSDQFWGGLVVIENSVFNNNGRVAEFQKYDFTNKSQFINCRFDGAGAISATTKGVSVWATDGITFNRCQFYNMEDYGITTWDAGVIVKEDNDFNQNTKGISSRATHPFSAYSEIGAQNSLANNFTNNIIDIEVYASDQKGGVKVINNNFSGANTAIKIKGPSQYHVENNVFSNSNGGLVAQQTGTFINHSDNLVQENDFLTNKGILAYGDNGNLQFLCNDFNVSSQDVLVSPTKSGTFPGKIHSHQGKFVRPAGNCFTNPGVVPDIVTNQPTVTFTYFYETSPDCKIPLHLGNYEVAGSPNANQDCFVGETTSHTISDFINILQALEQLETNGQNQGIVYQELLISKENVLQYLLEDYLKEDKLNDAIDLLNMDGSLRSQLIQYGLLLNYNEYDEAEVVLNNLDNSITEITEFKQIQTINLDRLTTQGVYTLNPADQALLVNIADGELGVSAYARAVLSLTAGIEYVDLLEDDKANERFTEAEMVAPTNFQVNPNPTNGLVNITLDKNYHEKLINVQVSNLDGKVVFRSQSYLGNELPEIDLSNLSRGIYLLMILDENERNIFTHKLVKF